MSAIPEPRKGVEPPAELTKCNNTYGMEVDSEGKAKSIKIFSFGQPHMMAFHISWFAFMMVFTGTFAPAALIDPIRENLNLTRNQLGNAGVASVCAAIGARVVLGTLLDTKGPRIITAGIMLLIAPAVFLISLVTDFSTFATARFFIGASLAMFVCCSYWVGSMFNVRIVGTANAIAAGWGNMGGGLTALIMPLIYEGIKHHGGVPGFEAWRWAFFVPGAIYVLSGMTALMFGTDHPSGEDYRTLRKQGVLKADGAVWPVFKVAATNYRTWILCLTYGYCFGVELTVDNMIVGYVYDNFPVSYSIAGVIGAIFGLMNLFTRATGGMISDIAGKYFGMRGRLWALWIIQTLGGAFCLIMGYQTHSLTGTIITMIIFSIFCQQACGAHYGITPFVSRRSYGVVAGIVGAGGNVGSAITQALFYTAKADWQIKLQPQDGLIYMGIMTMILTMSLFFIHFPMWGGMVTRASPTVSEEDYYIREWSPEEISEGLHHSSMRFAMESRSQRGVKGQRALDVALAQNSAGLSSSGKPSIDSIAEPVKVAEPVKTVV